MARASEVAAQVREAITDQRALTKVEHAMGRAGKDVATKQARRSLGTDQKMRGIPRAKLGAGYDLKNGGELVLKLRPAGLWHLADRGRHREKRIYPKRKQALGTPWGPKASVRLGSSRGLGTLDTTLSGLSNAVVKAATGQVAANIREAGWGAGNLDF